MAIAPGRMESLAFFLTSELHHHPLGQATVGRKSGWIRMVYIHESACSSIGIEMHMELIGILGVYQMGMSHSPHVHHLVFCG